MVSKSQLKEFQATKVAELSAKTAEFLLDSGRGVIVYEAPTGSGKTVTLGWAISETEDALDTAADAQGVETPRVVFLWLSIGKGDLEQQSLAVLRGIIPVRTHWVTDLNNADQVQEGAVIVANWEQLKARRRGAEKAFYEEDLPGKASLRTILSTLKARANWRVVLVIDESHEAASSELSKSIVEAFGADVVIEASATPQPSRAYAYANFKHFKVSKSTVREQGLIKAGILTNSGVGEFEGEGKGLLRSLIGAALAKRATLESLLRAEQPVSSVVPLLLIQLESGYESKERQAEVEEVLSEFNVSRLHRNLAVWLDGDGFNREGIKQLDSPVTALLFKVAVATGWDCPRAHVLLQLRDNKSEVLEEQVIGRISRSAEPHRADAVRGDCYSREDLNYAYIYSQYKPERVKRYDGSEDADDLYEDSVRWAGYAPLRLQSRFIRRKTLAGLATTTHEASTWLVSAWQALSTSATPAVTVSRQLADGLKFTFENVRVSDGRQVSVQLSPDEVSRLFDKLLTERLPGGLRRFVRSVIKPAVEDAVLTLFDVCNGEYEAAQALFINNVELFAAGLIQVGDQLRLAMTTEQTAAQAVANASWEAPELQVVKRGSAKVSLPFPLLHALPKAGLSGPELRFLEQLRELHTSAATRVQIEWAWRNGKDNEKALSVPYQDDQGGEHNAFPDFLVLFRTPDGLRLAACEVKDDDDAEDETVWKANALKQWALSRPAAIPIVADVMNMHGNTAVALAAGQGLLQLVLGPAEEQRTTVEVEGA